MASKHWAGKVDFYGVAWSGDESSFQEFIDRHGLTFAQISDPSGAVYAHFSIPVQPAFVLVGGGEVRTLLGAVDTETLDAELALLVAGSE